MDFLAIPDFSTEELHALFDLADRMRRGEYHDKPLAGKSLAMIFMKSSTRTRVSFEVGAWQLGGHALFLSPRDIQLGRGEPIADTARVLSRYVDGIMIRTFAHAEVEELAKYASVPVINGLTDLLHPCQILADLLTVRQHLGGWDGKRIAWVGDGNNMANSWINAAYRLGFELTLACPEGYDPDPAILARNRAKARITVSRDPKEAVSGADVVNTDVWASMGQEAEQLERARAFQGYIVDDCTVYRFEDKLMIVVNASNRAKAWEHIVDQKGGINVRLRDISDDIGLLALQGPKAEALMQPLTDQRLADIPYYHFSTGKVAGVDCFISRTGYTGEDGFELYCRWGDTAKLWDALIAAGAQPIGLGARDSLRLEMGYALYGNDIDENLTPLEAGLGWIVKLDKGSRFTGSDSLKAQKQHGVTRKLVGFQTAGRSFPRHGYPVYYDGKQVDIVRSGTVSPSLGVGIGTTYLPAAVAKTGTKFEIEIRGERVPAEVVARPFWKHGSARKQ
jgi:ornithine carbamoyltransferase